MKKVLKTGFLTWLCLTLILLLSPQTACFAGSLLDSVFPRQASQNHAPLHGNTESKVYHSADCEHYNCKSCTKIFTSAQQAKAAGFHACSICGGEEGTIAKRKAASGWHGNPSSMVLHGPSCKYYNAKNSTEVFHSLEEAKRKGYRLCTLCNGK
ncbi:MAG: hypothetical protein K6G15_01205 [Desulfovibrio sp.]|nr:hypothetical protein [Desulfovibrio sp.]